MTGGSVQFTQGSKGTYSVTVPEGHVLHDLGIDPLGYSSDDKGNLRIPFLRGRDNIATLELPLGAARLQGGGRVKSISKDGGTITIRFQNEVGLGQALLATLISAQQNRP